MDWQAGEAEEPQEEQLDPGLWEPPAEEKADQPPLDDETKGADKVEQSLAAKDDRLPDDQGSETGEQNAAEETEGPEEEKDEMQEEFDLENVNLDDKDDQEAVDEKEDESDVEGEGETEEDVIGNEEKMEELDGEESNEEKPKDDNSSAAEKTFSSSGADNKSKQTGEVGDAENYEPEDKSRDVDKDEATGEDEDQKKELGQANRKERESERADHPSGETVKKQSKERTGKRTSPEMNGQSGTKRQRVADDEKTMGNQDDPIKRDVEIEQVDVDDGQDDAEMANESDRIFSHQRDVGAEGAQIIDSASVETALKQSLDTRRALMMAEEEKSKRKESTTEDDQASKNTETTRSNQEQHMDELKERMEESIDIGSIIENRETASTIHTVMDFYTHVSL